MDDAKVTQHLVDLIKEGHTLTDLHSALDWIVSHADVIQEIKSEGELRAVSALLSPVNLRKLLSCHPKLEPDPKPQPTPQPTKRSTQRSTTGVSTGVYFGPDIAEFLE